MNADALSLQPIIDRIAEMVPAMHQVGGAAELDLAQDQAAIVPAAFVLPARETASDNAYGTQQVEQLITCDFAVVIAVENMADTDGRAAYESLRPIRGAVRNALLGWTDDESFEGIEYAAGEFVQFANGALWWQDTYSTRYIIRSA